MVISAELTTPSAGSSPAETSRLIFRNCHASMAEWGVSIVPVIKLKLSYKQ